MECDDMSFEAGDFREKIWKFMRGEEASCPLVSARTGGLRTVEEIAAFERMTGEQCPQGTFRFPSK